MFVARYNPPVTEMRKVSGGFPGPLFETIRRNPALVRRISETVLKAHFPGSYHNDVLVAAGLSLEIATAGRDSGFRDLVLNAYGYRCGICGLDPHLDGVITGLEAAHVRWHSHGGPSTVDNGVAMCPLHHKAFDLGLIGIDERLRVVVSVRLHGGDRVEEFLGMFHGQTLLGPLHDQTSILGIYRDWHQREVFKAPARP